MLGLFSVQCTLEISAFIEVANVEKLRLRNFHVSQVFSFDFSTLYTSLPHDLIKSKALSLVNWCFNRESNTYICTSDKAGFLAAISMTRINVGLVLSYVKLMQSIYVQFEGMAYQQLIPMGTNCSTHSGFVFIVS